MTYPKALKDVYADELKDLWSANDQMTRVVKVMADKSHDGKLKAALEKSVAGIKSHSDTIKSLLKDAGEEAQMDYCKGMQGLVKEATKHITDEAPQDAALMDLVIIAQYQRMSHYGLAGFGTAAAYAKALGMKEHSTKLARIVTDIYKGDEYASNLASKAENAAAAA